MSHRYTEQPVMADGDQIADLRERLRAAEEQLKQIEAEMDRRERVAYVAGAVESDVTVHSLLNSMADGVLIVDVEGRILFVNSRIEAMFRHSAADLLGQPLSLLLPEGFAERHNSHLESFFRDPGSRSMGVGLDIQARCSDGSHIPVEISLSYMKNERGTFAIAYIADFTRQKEREAYLEARNQELDAFSHMVAHDLKSSLSLVIGFGELLQADYRTMQGSEIEETLGAIVQSSRKMNAVIQDLLVFARLRDEPVVIETVDNRAILTAALSRLAGEMEARDAQILLPDHLEPALGHGPWLEEVWLNYLGNAIKYGGNPPVIRVGSDRTGATVRFWVRDNGEGLTDAQQQGIFRPFARRHTGAAQGHGLGLSIVRRIVTRLGGNVGVESRPGHGSTFYFTLPAPQSDTPS